jgi:hypothetical protein
MGVFLVTNAAARLEDTPVLFSIFCADAPEAAIDLAWATAFLDAAIVFSKFMVNPLHN